MGTHDEVPPRRLQWCGLRAHVGRLRRHPARLRWARDRRDHLGQRLATPEMRRADVAVSAVALSLGVLAMVMPWNRWGTRSTLILLPAVLVLIGFGNYANPDPYTADIFFVVVAMWTGLCHGRGVTLYFAPLIAIAYWWPLSLRDPLPTLAHRDRGGRRPCRSWSASRWPSCGVGLDDAQVRLIESKERRFATLVQRSSDVTLIFDDHGTIAYVSAAIYDTFGHRPDELHGWHARRVRRVTGARHRRPHGRPASWTLRAHQAAVDSTFGEVVELELRPRRRSLGAHRGRRPGPLPGSGHPWRGRAHPRRARAPAAGTGAPPPGVPRRAHRTAEPHTLPRRGRRRPGRRCHALGGVPRSRRVQERQRHRRSRRGGRAPPTSGGAPGLGSGRGGGGRPARR